jgi:putative ABC transport system permease protein
MLAAERRSEMGMARAVGTHRRQLIQQFVAEGAGYALLAGIVGPRWASPLVGIANAMKVCSASTCRSSRGSSRAVWSSPTAWAWC